MKKNNFFEFYKESSFEQMEWVGKSIAQQKVRERRNFIPKSAQRNHFADEKTETPMGKILLSLTLQC